MSVCVGGGRKSCSDSKLKIFVLKQFVPALDLLHPRGEPRMTEAGPGRAVFAKLVYELREALVPPASIPEPGLEPAGSDPAL